LFSCGKMPFLLGVVERLRGKFGEKCMLCHSDFAKWSVGHVGHVPHV
jgi:hypothetical protein